MYRLDCRRNQVLCRQDTKNFDWKNNLLLFIILLLSPDGLGHCCNRWEAVSSTAYGKFKFLFITNVHRCIHIYIYIYIHIHVSIRKNPAIYIYLSIFILNTMVVSKTIKIDAIMRMHYIKLHDFNRSLTAMFVKRMDQSVYIQSCIYHKRGYGHDENGFINDFVRW